MNRRGFLINLLKLGIAPMILPPALTYAREWVNQSGLFVAADGVRQLTLSESQFTQFLIDEAPNYDRLILQSIAPTDGWIGHIQVGGIPIGADEVFRDRLADVYPDMRIAQAQHFVGAPLDLPKRGPLERLRDSFNRFADKLTIS